jgi:catechol 2,3-dioxygenase-like lactoylglutathione lyase family enzyme
MDLRLELVVVPVSDVDRAKAFYAEKLGFNVDHDTRVTDEYRVIQLTPPGSACSIAIQTFRPSGTVGKPPSPLQGLQLVVSDIHAAHAYLVERGVEVSEVQVFDGGSFRPSRAGDALDYAGFIFFRDPDGNSWAVQQMPARD